MRRKASFSPKKNPSFLIYPFFFFSSSFFFFLTNYRSRIILSSLHPFSRWLSDDYSKIRKNVLFNRYSLDNLLKLVTCFKAGHMSRYNNASYCTTWRGWGKKILKSLGPFKKKKKRKHVRSTRENTYGSRIYPQSDPEGRIVQERNKSSRVSAWFK